MATCERCGKGMEPGGTCISTTFRMVDGQDYEPIPIGRGVQYDVLPARPTLSSRNAERLRERGFEDLAQRIHVGDIRCHDCGVSLGSYHHQYCDMEECPRCHGQLFPVIACPTRTDSRPRVDRRACRHSHTKLLGTDRNFSVAFAFLYIDSGRS